MRVCSHTWHVPGLPREMHLEPAATISHVSPLIQRPTAFPRALHAGPLSGPPAAMQRPLTLSLHVRTHSYPSTTHGPVICAACPLHASACMALHAPVMHSPQTLLFSPMKQTVPVFFSGPRGHSAWVPSHTGASRHMLVASCSPQAVPLVLRLAPLQHAPPFLHGSGRSRQPPAFPTV